VTDLFEKRETSDLLIASRYVEGGTADMSQFRLLLSKVLNTVYGLVLDLPYRDLSTGFRLYRRTALEGIQFRSEKFDVLPEILVLLYAKGCSISETPFNYQPRKSGRSHARLIPFGWAFITTLYRMSRLRRLVREERRADPR